jgi:outer membrane protein OmpA-like peptidoglycan-associated protein
MFPSRALATLLLVAPFALQAQNLLQRTLQHDTMPNLVPNPGFEEVKRLQCGWTQNTAKFNEEVMVAWTSPTETTPDHFSTRNDRDCWAHPAKRSKGRAAPRTGNAMAGMKVWGRGNTPTFWHEYLQCELLEPLEAGQRYIAEMWVMRANWSNEASNNLGMHFTGVPVRSRDCLPLYLTPQVNEEKVVKKSGWHKVSGVFEAAGGERYLLLGNFYSDDETLHERQPEGERGAYYFIDDVNVRLAPEGTALSPTPRESVPPPPRKVPEQHASSKEVDIHAMEPAVGTRVRLDNVQFEFDKSDLLPGYEEELGKLVDLMTDFPHMRVEIEGHTDDQGTDAYNDKLSEARAQAVVDHLVKKKVSRDRITAKGYGKRQPLVPNTSEENRAINRRVEFRVLER